MPRIVEIPETKVLVDLDEELLAELEEEGQVIVHCSLYNDPTIYAGEIGVRVWKETFLIDEQTGVMNQMVRAFGIVYQPDWHYVKSGQTKKFTMIFDALPKHCRTFTLAEIIPQPGAFIVKGIKRNNSDIYSIKLD